MGLGTNTRCAGMCAEHDAYGFTLYFVSVMVSVYVYFIFVLLRTCHVLMCTSHKRSTANFKGRPGYLVITLPQPPAL